MSKTGTGVGYGRICLWGDHCDWAKKQVIASSIAQKMTAQASFRDDMKISIKATNTAHDIQDLAEFSLDKTGEMPLRDSSLSYVNAVMLALIEIFPEAPRGTDLIIRSNLPMRRGLSSSAAICISTAAALNDLWDLGLEGDDIINVAYRAERDILGIACGMMDQAVSLYGCPLYIDFTDDFSCDRIRPGKPIPLLIGDVGGQRNTRLILESLNRNFFSEGSSLIKRTLAIDIPEIVKHARSEMEGRCSLQKLGELLDENQECYNRGLRPFCESELGNPLLYRALESARDSGALGTKWTGAGGAGSIIAIAPGMEEGIDMARKMEKTCTNVILTSIEQGKQDT